MKKKIKSSIEEKRRQKREYKWKKYVVVLCILIYN